MPYSALYLGCRILVQDTPHSAVAAHDKESMSSQRHRLFYFAISGLLVNILRLPRVCAPEYLQCLRHAPHAPYTQGYFLYRETPGGPADKANFVILLQELRAAFVAEAQSTGRPRLQLSAALAVGSDTIARSYDVQGINANLDLCAFSL